MRPERASGLESDSRASDPRRYQAADDASAPVVYSRKNRHLLGQHVADMTDAQGNPTVARKIPHQSPAALGNALASVAVCQGYPEP